MFQLQSQDKEKIREIIRKGTCAREISRAHVLSLRQKNYTVIEISDILEISPRTVINVTNHYCEGGLEKALKEDPRPGQPIKFDDRIKAEIVAIVCSHPPEGFDRWTLELLKEQVIKNEITDEISKESIRVILKEHDLKPWQQKMWCVPKLDAEYIQRMEDVLGVYEKSYKKERPVICLDEKTVCLEGDRRDPILCKPGCMRKIDYEYIRNGSINIFCAVEGLRGIYKMKVTNRKNGKAFANFLSILEKKYHHAEKIVLVTDNYGTHTQKALTDSYGMEAGKKLWKRFEVHYTPKHASWLNQSEISIGMYSRQCLGGMRISEPETLIKKTKAWERIINNKKVNIKWKFTKSKAREKFSYAKINLSEH